MSEQQPVVNITGEHVALGPLRRDLISLHQRWFNDFETDRTQGDLPGPRTLERATRWFERNATSDDAHWFTIYEMSSWQPIGITWLSDIDDKNGTCYFAISIGEPSARGKGYGSEVTRLMLDFAFNRLGLHNVALDVFENNPAGIRAYQKAGFREFARVREAYVSGGRRWDDILMEAIAEEPQAADAQ
ncbi:MAG TPA: GNAT family protein [Thermomicrobiales bacterium]|nr:GNAT family protein [Thermomicrobiales bacterium]